jgi:hypothetical protein
MGAVYAQSNITWTFDGKGIYEIKINSFFICSA